MVVVALRLPDVPVMVSVLVPTLAALSAVNVRLLDPVVGFGEMEAVTPVGRPELERFTLPVNPYIAFTNTKDVCEVPWPISTNPGPESVKLGAWTPRLMVVVAVKLPDFPVIVNVLVLEGAELLAVRVKTLFPDVGFALHEAVTPLGRPDTARSTFPVNPYCGVTVIV